MRLRTGLWAAMTALPTTGMAQGAFELDEAFVFSSFLPVEVNRTGASVEVITQDDLTRADQRVQETITRLPGKERFVHNQPEKLFARK